MLPRSHFSASRQPLTKTAHQAHPAPPAPAPRAISNAVATQTESVENSRGASDFLWQWGQFIDHDIDETPTAEPSEEFDILVPTGDVSFDPTGTGTVTMSLDRSTYVEDEEPRQQVNAITAFIDASMVYGSDETRAFALRTLDGTGLLKVSEGDFLPFNEDGLPNAGGVSDTLFIAGDVRANEQVGLATMHTLFVREHNYWAARIAESDPSLTGEQLYQMARSIVAGELQAITYREFLPVLLGSNALPTYQGYNADVDPGIANVFAAAAYRVGHTMLSTELLRLDSEGEEIEAGNLSLAGAFFRPDEVTTNGLEPVLRGLASQKCQEIDNFIIDDVRNFLFGAPGAGGFDLASLNIQRGRDHGLPSYNAVREAYGLDPVTEFTDISKDTAVTTALASVYDTVDDIDPWIGGLCETHVSGAMVGETFFMIIADQFTRLRDGDRFFYKNDLSDELIELVEDQTLATIIKRNTEIDDEIEDDVFIAPEKDKKTSRRRIQQRTSTRNSSSNNRNSGRNTSRLR